MTCEKIHFFLWRHSGSNWPVYPHLLRRVVLPFHGKRSSHMFSGSAVDKDVTIYNCMTESTENWIFLGSARWLRSVVVALTGVITCWYFWKRCWKAVGDVYPLIRRSGLFRAVRQNSKMGMKPSSSCPTTTRLLGDYVLCPSLDF